ncbi:PH domain-containing protein [Candidatus Methanosphaera massiliense]|jgi:membrane protein YdbS with pleckstrin-like domain|uniref:PH domain-containing protein n=1 Tax=Methanosphaera TaxID=2316 RepID=UPI0023803A18|nr:PH domain-containing protein [Candidatus Methanosphaera massiliense]MDD6286118.1 PH domain-containing protein [Methanobacteriaceae archaeon]MDE4077717.1 PH domain-containing protein [Candidatus Methanosphaera massiliense]MDY2745405.1 PH domain-containing protein [Methanosphaera sp.]
MMPKPNNSRTNNKNNNDFQRAGSEKILLETKPNIFCYCENFIFKIILLFILVFLFAPIVTIFYNIQDTLLTSFQMNFTNLTSIMELLLIFCILIVLVKILLDILDWNYTKYVLTNQRIIIQRGFFRKEKIMMPYRKVQDIEISQNMLERIINVGDILIYGGHDNSDTILDDIPDPKSAEEIILSHISDYNEYPPNYPPNYNPNYYNNGYNRNYGYDDRYDNREYDDRYDYHEYNRYEENNQAPPIENRNYYRDDNDYSHEQENNSQNNSFINKWNKNKQKYKKSKMNKDEIMERHQRMFKKYNE